MTNYELNREIDRIGEELRLYQIDGDLYHVEPVQRRLSDDEVAYLWREKVAEIKWQRFIRTLLLGTVIGLTLWSAIVLAMELFGGMR